VPYKWNFKIIIIVLMGLGIIFVVISNYKDINSYINKYVSNTDNRKIKNALTDTQINIEQEKLALELISSRLINNEGLLGDSILENVSPQHILLESMGQLMEYAILSNNRALFAITWDITKKHMQAKEGYYYWRLTAENLKADDATSFIDLLRMVKSLGEAASRFNTPEYNEEAKKVAETIVTYNIEDGLYCDAYDGRLMKRELRLSLFYIDPKGLNYLNRFWPASAATNANALKVLINVPVTKEGFYPAWFDTVNKQYHYSEGINMVENLYTASYLLESGQDIKPFLDFLRMEMNKEGRINNIYKISDGVKGEGGESTAVYALACRLFQKAGDPETTGRIYNRMMEFQILDKKSLIYGAFGDITSNSLYTFDQLEALLTMRIWGGRAVENSK